MSAVTTPPLDRFPVVLFDLDGTITDSAPGIHGGFRHALATVGHPEPTEAMLASVIGPPMVDTFRTLGLDDAAVDAAMAAYLRPWAGQRGRVPFLVAVGGLYRPRRGPRMSPRGHLPTRDRIA